MAVALTDPMERTRKPVGAVSRGLARFVCDARDVPFLWLMLWLTLTVVSTGLLLFVPGQFRWWLAGVHTALVLYFVGPYTLMLHNTSHRRLFPRRTGWMNAYIPWVLGPFMGQSPETYLAHHIGMHHAENNLEDDLSSTMGYQRDSFIDFMRYFLRFFFFGLPELALYHARRKHKGLMTRTIVGEITFYAAVAALLWLDWRPTLVVFVGPFVVVRFAMMAGNWGQHAFIDAADPGNAYTNSVTCINSVYNQRCFNDGYHIGHHVKANRHWLEMAEDFERNIPKYAAERALVFTGLDNFTVWLNLMLKRYEFLANRVVQLGETPIPRETIIALLHERVRKIEGPVASTVAAA